MCSPEVVGAPARQLAARRPPAPATDGGKTALAPLKSTCEGWREYFRHSVRYAGIGLALLYMTVLGFDNITYGER